MITCVIPPAAPTMNSFAVLAALVSAICVAREGTGISVYGFTTMTDLILTGFSGVYLVQPMHAGIAADPVPHPFIGSARRPIPGQIPSCGVALSGLMARRSAGLYGIRGESWTRGICPGDLVIDGAYPPAVRSRYATGRGTELPGFYAKVSKYFWHYL